MRQRLLVDRGHVAAVLAVEVRFVGREQRDDLGVLRRALERLGGHGVRLDARHPQLAHRRPQRLRQRRLVGERPEVAALLRQLEQQPHHQRRAEALFRRVDAALDEERRAHAQRDVERRDEAQVQPVGAAERDALAERAAERVRRHEHPLRAGALGRTQTSELGDERIDRRLRNVQSIATRRSCQSARRRLRIGLSEWHLSSVS